MPSWRYPDGYGPNSLWSLIEPWSRTIRMASGQRLSPRPVGFELQGVRYDAAFTASSGVFVEGDEFGDGDVTYDFSVLEEVLGQPMLVGDGRELYGHVSAGLTYSVGGGAYAGKLLERVLGFMVNVLGADKVGIHCPPPSQREKMPLLIAAQQIETGARCRGIVMGMRLEPAEVEEADSLSHLLRPDLDEFEAERRKFYAAVGDGR